MILVDERAGSVALGVEDLIDAGPAGIAGPVDEERAALEAELRGAYAAGARSDVALGAELDWRGRRVLLEGRADVLRAEADGARLEIAVFEPDDEAELRTTRARERAGFAALLLALSGERVAGARVVALSLSGAALRSEPVEFAPEVWAQRLDERMERIARAAELGQERVETRRALEPPFPFGEPRPVQAQMVREVEGAAQAGLVLLCAAPTGVGKTAAALHPFLVEALRNDRRVLFTTSKNTQQELALDTLRRMLPPGGGALAVQISAKHRVCPQARLRCVERRCPWQRRFPERLADSGLLDALEAEGVVTAARVAERASEHDLCPFETSLALALRATVVVCDFNYVFDPHVYLRRFLDPGSGRDLLIVDEAHELPERARAAFSPELELAALERLAAHCAVSPEPEHPQAAAVLRDAAALCREIADRLAEERNDDAPWVEPAERGRFGPLALRAATSLLALQARAATREHPGLLAPVAEPRDGRLRDPLQTALAAVRDFAHGVESADPERHACLWSPERAKLACLDPAPWLGARIRGFHAALLMSATLAPLDFHARLLGVAGPRTVQLDLPSPFPRENRLLVAVDSVETRFRVRSDNAAPIADLLARCLRTRAGNWLAFFPSFAFRDEVLAKLPPDVTRVLLQLPGVPVEPILARLRANQSTRAAPPRAGRDTLLVAAVQGGVLAEGVDYPGEMAIGVFVVGPGLPKVERERELLRALFDAELGAGFEYAYLLPGLARAAQAAGRVLRSAEDVAAIVLVDRRFTEPQYRERLPAWWREELVATPDPVPALERFWLDAGRRARGLSSSQA